MSRRDRRCQAAKRAMRSISAEPERRPARHKGAEYLLLVSGTTAAALAGLVAEDFLPEPRTCCMQQGICDLIVWNPQWLRIALLLVAIGLGALAVRWLKRRRASRGTLYYLRFQNETNPDYHRAAVAKASGEYLGFRAISAWCDPQEDIVDVRRAVSGISAEFERAINDDSDDSGYHLAPNLMFPVALAVGYEWIPPQGVTLREFSQSNDKVDLQDFQWDLACASTAGCGLKSKCGGPHFDPSDTSAFRVVADTERRDEGVADSEVPTVWLEFRLTDRDYTISAQAMKSPLKDAAAVSRVVHVAGPHGDEGVEPDYLLLKYGIAPDVEASGLAVRQIAEGAAYWLGQTLRDFPKATVFIAAATPKTVSLAIGYLLTQPPLTTPASHPWRRIVPMCHFGYEPYPQLRPMWVRHDQADPRELIARNSTGGGSQDSLATGAAPGPLQALLRKFKRWG